MSAIPIRTGVMTDGFRETISNKAKVLSGEDMCTFICIIWSIWRMRNEVIHGTKVHSVHTCKGFFKKEIEACQIRRLTGGMNPTKHLTQSWEQQRDPQQDQLDYPYQCYVDGAWDSQGKAGIGVFVQHRGEVVCWMSKSVQAINLA